MTLPQAHPANAALVRRWQHATTLAALLHPDDVARPYDSLGTHPDLVARLWDELGGVLPEDCRMVFCGMPVLMHPRSGVVFAFAGGTHTYALRLPVAQHAAALAAGATRIMRYPVRQPDFDLAEIGPEWVFGRWFQAEPDWCRAAHAFAGAAGAG